MADRWVSPVKDDSKIKAFFFLLKSYRTLASMSDDSILLQTCNNIYLVCLLPLRSCCATEAHLSASCVTSLRCRRRSLSGNFFISDSSIKALKLTRPFGKDIKLT